MADRRQTAEAMIEFALVTLHRDVMASPDRKVTLTPADIASYQTTPAATKLQFAFDEPTGNVIVYQIAPGRAT